MAGRLLFPQQRALDNTGAPISGAKAYTFKTGTSTNQATYTSSALSVAHTNPVVSDAYGNFPDMYAASDLAYRVFVSDGSESSFAGATALPDADHDPVYAQGSGVNPAPRTLTSVTTLTSDDLNRNLYCSGTWALTLPLGAGLSAGWKTQPINTGTGTITLTCQGSDLVNSASTLALGRKTAWVVEWTGSTWNATEIPPARGGTACGFRLTP
jgi:hypothetical protein